ncbi:hypothetical protein NDI76_19725 [Halogeometricum sp. S1BR25-6]|uniref:DUF8160 domain-containing protein n=1 Tax=Halogeometricum salsisoli TaxID=2950536 RepID=A0ABU2GL14_9EURY|nr:hypothetical protein [Halogeometricum sp. S1BR25-6]MDS0300979.1 hypothetical protein [Halogeometricum sp. S1BR25-6]
MSDDLEDRKQETWNMSEVRSTGASSEAEDNSDTSDTEDAYDIKDTQDESDIEEKADTEDITDKEDTSDTAEGNTVRQMSIDAERKGFAVRDLHNVNVYLYEDIYRDMVATFKDLDSEYFRVHGDELTKNKEFFNAVFKAGLESDQLREELELE